MASEENKKTCFVVMGFGKKTDFESGRVLDLDKSYRNMIKPAVEAAGLTCIRADEIVHSGMIDVPMYEQLLNADVVVADLSTSNKNAFYELGIRHALRPFTTIIIAEDGIKTFPFDISHIAVRQYHHLGDDIGFDEVMRFRALLTAAIKDILVKSEEERGDSPVYTFLKNLTPPAIAAAVQAKVQERGMGAAISAMATMSGPAASSPGNDSGNVQTRSILMAQVDKAQKDGSWATAKTLLNTVRRMAREEQKRQREIATVKNDIEQPEDTFLLQRLAFATYKDESIGKKQALTEARDILRLLNPDTSKDMETLGLWGSVHKRLWDLDKNTADLDEAIKAQERGFFMANDQYNGINLAFLLNARAANNSDADEATTDKVTASRVRKKVLEICNTWLQNYPEPDAAMASPEALNEYRRKWFWIKSTMGEAYIGLGDEANAKQILHDAYAKAPEPWMRKTSEDQLTKLKQLMGS